MTENIRRVPKRFISGKKDVQKGKLVNSLPFQWSIIQHSGVYKGKDRHNRSMISLASCFNIDLVS